MRTVGTTTNSHSSTVLKVLLAVVLAVGLVPGVSAAFADEAEANSAAGARAYAGFSDVQSSDWFAKEGWLDYALANGLMQGIGNGQFNPNGAVSRGQVAVVLHRMAGEPAVGGVAFSDVDYTMYYGQAVLWAREAGVVQGDGTNQFHPDASVTREELAVMLWNFTSRVAGVTMRWDASALDRIAGSESVSSWARDAMEWAVDKRIITGELIDGVTYVNAGGPALRCAFAKMASVEHRDVLGLAQGETVGGYPTTPTYRTGDTVVLTGVLVEERWQHTMGPQSSYILHLDEPATFIMYEHGSYATYNNVRTLQIYEDWGTISYDLIGKHVTVSSQVFERVSTWWQRESVLLRGNTVVRAS